MKKGKKNKGDGLAAMCGKSTDPETVLSMAEICGDCDAMFPCGDDDTKQTILFLVASVASDAYARGVEKMTIADFRAALGERLMQCAARFK